MPPIKPARWAVNPAGVSPEWQWAWRDQNPVVALAEFGDTLSIPISRETAADAASDGGTIITVLGPAITGIVAGGEDFEFAGTAPYMLRQADRPFTQVAVVTNFLDGNTNSGMTLASQSTNGYSVKLSQFPNTGKIGFTKAGVVDIASSINTPGYPAVVVCIVRENRTVDFYVGNILTGEILVDESQTNSATWTTGSGNAKFYRQFNAASGAFNAWYQFKGALSMEQIRQLTADPFGPIRPHTVPNPDQLSRSSSATIDFLQEAGSDSDLTTYTFSSQNLGAAAYDRKIAVLVHTFSTGGPSVSTVTVGGISATKVAEGTDNDAVLALFTADVPSGTSGDVVVTFGAAALRCGIGMYRLTGVDGVYDFDVNDAGVSGNQSPVNLAVEDGGVVLAGFELGGVFGATLTWKGDFWVARDSDYFDRTGDTEISLKAGTHDAFTVGRDDLQIIAGDNQGAQDRVVLAASFSPTRAREEKVFRTKVFVP